MVVTNFIEETSEIETVSRYNGGWLKTVTSLDKSKKGGYSIVGEFVNAGDYKENYAAGLYIDCSKEGSRKNQKWNYHLFKLNEDGSWKLLKTLEDSGRNWAVEFWEKIEEELENDSSEINAQDIINMIYEKTSDETIIAEVISTLIERTKKPTQVVEIFGEMITVDDFKTFLKVNKFNEIQNTEDGEMAIVETISGATKQFKKSYTTEEIKNQIEKEELKVCFEGHTNNYLSKEIFDRFDSYSVFSETEKMVIIANYDFIEKEAKVTIVKKL